ncbi:HAD family hydrolase, partial [Vibrio cholerae]|nr:HAD family hydrolase [Vibrio cholerae]
AEGYKLGVCSNSIRNTVETMMDKAALSQYLDIIVSNEDVKVGKPDPEMYIKAMEYLNLSPEECLIVEDNENGIRAAKASGAHLLVVKDVYETNYTNVMSKLMDIES